MLFSFEALLEVRERAQAWSLESADPTLSDRVDRYRVDEMKLLPPLAPRRHEVGVLEDREMLRNGLASHLEFLAELAQRLPVLLAQPIQQVSATGIREGSEHGVVIHLFNMQPNGSLSSVPRQNHSGTQMDTDQG